MVVMAHAVPCRGRTSVVTEPGCSQERSPPVDSTSLRPSKTVVIETPWVVEAADSHW
jgi:hypothetical protein